LNICNSAKLQSKTHPLSKSLEYVWSKLRLMKVRKQDLALQTSSEQTACLSTR